MNTWVKGNIINIKHWTQDIFTLILHAPVNFFIAGQFTKIRLTINHKKIHRSYSYVNSPKSNNLEFYLVSIKTGQLSKYLNILKKGDEIYIRKKSLGSFIINNVKSCKNLWLISTGTAIGPYLSILNQKENIHKFKKIILVHSVRLNKEFSYENKIKILKDKYKNKLLVQKIVSREKIYGSISGRIPLLIYNGLLEYSVNLNINSKDSHVMLCGNPNMIKDAIQILENFKDMKKNLFKNNGNITSENYW
ncbi:MAG: FAD-binding oxidoreductase [Candidatus Makana argininalis]